MSDVTRLLQAIQAGSPGAADRLAEEVYAELRRMASKRLAREPGRGTLAPTALVHEAWLRFGPQRSGPQRSQRHFENRAHFFAAGAEAMRRILVDRARRRRRLKHGAAWRREAFDESEQTDTGGAGGGNAWELPEGNDLLDLHEALVRLSEGNERKARLVELRFFGGLSQVEAAEVLGISRATADRDWAYARAWLLAALDPDE